MLLNTHWLVDCALSQGEIGAEGDRAESGAEGLQGPSGERGGDGLGGPKGERVSSSFPNVFLLARRYSSSSMNCEVLDVCSYR